MSSARYKDLYLSGGVYLGGTGSANKLEDYEEGTWTPHLDSGGTTSTAQVHKYVKVGNQVTISGYTGFSSIPNDGAIFQIGGLPFTIGSLYQAGSIGYVGSATLTNYLLIGSSGGDYLYFHYAGGNSVRRLNSDVVGNNLAAMIYSFTYIVD